MRDDTGSTKMVKFDVATLQRLERLLAKAQELEDPLQADDPATLFLYALGGTADPPGVPAGLAIQLVALDEFKILLDIATTPHASEVELGQLVPLLEGLYRRLRIGSVFLLAVFRPAKPAPTPEDPETGPPPSRRVATERYGDGS